MADQLDFKQLSEDELVAFYGALFAMSAIDGHMDKDERNQA